MNTNIKPKFQLLKLLLVFITTLLLLLVASCSSSQTSSTGTAEDGKSSDLPAFPIKGKDDLAILKGMINKDLSYDIVNSDPDKYKDEIVEWSGRVFTEPEIDDSGVYLQVFTTGNDKNFIVGYQDPSFKVKMDDYIVVTGKIKGKFEGKNAFGAALEVPVIVAGYVEKTTRGNALSPAISTVPVNVSNSQNGFDVTVTKVELAKDETRFFLKVTNGSGEKISFYTYQAKVIQGNKQLEPKSLYNKAEELPSDTLPGVTAEGVLVFPAIDPQPKQIVLYLDKPYSGDWNKTWNEISLSVSLP
ncbi:MAG: DUF4352 domain-containing protein [Thermoleophilia bacterium]